MRRRLVTPAFVLLLLLTLANCTNGTMGFDDPSNPFPPLDLELEPVPEPDYSDPSPAQNDPPESGLLGFFWVADQAFLAIGSNEYCAFTSMAHYLASGGVNNSDTLPNFNQTPPNYVFVGSCPLRPGYFSMNGVSYYANDQRHYCRFVNDAHRIQTGGPVQVNPIFDLPLIPDSMTSDGVCALPQGFFIASGKLSYANASAHYCSYSSYGQFVSAGGPSDLTHVPDYGTIPQSMHYDGPCGTQEGFFFSGETGYYLNGAGHYCSFVSMSHYVSSGGNPNNSAIRRFDPLPAEFKYDGNCRLTQGFFFSDGTGYYANQHGHYCAFSSWTHYITSGGQGNLNLVDNHPTIPNSMVYDGHCRMAAGFFFSKGTGYYANAHGHYCSYTSWEHYIATGAPGDTALVPNYPHIPHSMKYDGACILAEGLFFVGSTGYYANNVGHYCVFVSWDHWRNSGGPENLSGINRYPFIPNSMKFDGACGGA